MNNKQRFLSLFLAILMIVTILPLNVFAGNNDGSGSGVGGTKPKPGTTISKSYEGLRVSVYWAPSLENFESGEGVLQVGKSVDLSKSNLHAVSDFTTASIYDYMANDSDYFKDTGNYKYFGKSIPVVEKMPGLFGDNNRKELWDEWFEGPFVEGKPTYKNIPEITKLTGHIITPEDFKNGIRDLNGERINGQYKIFFEPLSYPTIDGKGAALTLRDSIKHPRSSYLLSWIAPLFVLTSNAQYLIQDEPSISMTANNPKYTAVYSSGQAQRNEISKQIAKGGKIYNSMGVGVVTPVPVNDMGTVVSTFVKVVGVDTGGTLIYAEAAPTIVEPAVIDEDTEFLEIETVRTTDYGDALLNDIITSPKDLTVEKTFVSYVSENHVK